MGNRYTILKRIIRSCRAMKANTINPKLFLILLILFLINSGCLGPVKNLYPPEPGDPVKTIYVVSHGWHTGLVLNIADISNQQHLIPDFFKKSTSIEIGWGDEGFYRSKEFSFWTTVKAAIFPTPSVLHLVELHLPVEIHFPKSGIVKVNLSEQGFNNLCDFIEASYVTDANGNAVDSGPGIYGKSRFYQSNQSYFFPKTCNTWTASALRSAGCPITPVYAVRAKNVFIQTKKFGVVIQEIKEDD